MKVLVTGGAGFIGSHVVEKLLDEDCNVRIYDNLSTGNQKNISSLDVELIQGDIRDINLLNKAMQGVDQGFHLAACTSVSKSIIDSLLTNDINLTGSLNVLWSAVKHEVSRVVVSSSCAVYGDEYHNPPLKELDIYRPKSPYAASKIAIEAFAESFYHAHGLETICLRYFNVYGPRQQADSDYAAVIPRFIECYKQKKKPIVYGDGLQTRDFIHVKDVARANILAANYDILGKNRVFNIGTGFGISILKLLEIISNQTGYQITPEFQKSRIGDIRESWADCTLAKEQLSFIPLIDLETGIRNLYQTDRQ